MSDTIPEHVVKLVDRVRDELMEHFDAVRIFVSRHEVEDDKTGTYTTGKGNFYAQLGQVDEWTSIMHGKALERGAEDESEGDE
jgi:hypothetical protein